MPWPKRTSVFLPFFFAIAVLSLPSAVLGQSYVLGTPSAGSEPGEIEVNIHQVSKDGKAAFPAFDSVGDSSLWHIAVYEKAGGHLKPASPIAITSVKAADDYARTGQITLATSATYALDPHTNSALVIELNFLLGEQVTTAWMTPKPSGEGGATQTAPASVAGSSSAGSKSTGCGAATAQPAGVSYFHFCLSGIWVPQEGSHPLYSTNSNFAAAHSLWSGSFGLRGQESADSSVVIDPNAFSSALFYQAVLTNSSPVPRVMGVYFNWNLATTEFDRKKKNTNLGTNLNFITAPELVFPISFGRVAGAELDAGIEAGDNFKNNVDRNGFGTIFRGLLGAQAEKIFVPNEKLKALNQIKITSQYQVRLLAEDEVITKAVHGVLVPYVGHQARNWVSTELDFMFTKNFGLTLKHDYGALPPGFVFVENRGTVGFTVQSSQK